MQKKIIIIFLFYTKIAHSFTSLNEIKNYAETMPEYPQATVLDWTDPQYSSFYYENRPSFIKKIATAIGLIKPLWTVSDLEDAINLRLLRLSLPEQKQEHAVRIDTATEPTLYVWGNLHGSFHSLARALHFLEKEKVINADLKIIKSNCFFIFNGNVINGSPYSLETLTVILNLMALNPERVVYLKGEQEDNNFWRDFDIKRQLYIYGDYRTKEIRSEKKNLLTNLFATLPLALYALNNKDLKKPALRISFFNQLSSLLNDNFMGSFFVDNQKSTLMYYPLKEKEQTAQKPFIKAEIRAEEWRNEHRAVNGLGVMDQDKGATTWSVVSSPTTAYQTFNNFYYDAFVKINCNQILEKSTITLCNRDVRENKDFTYQTPYNLCSAIPTTNPLNYTGKEDIIFGSSMALIQGVPIMGQRTLHGMMARLLQENSIGGINGHIMRIIVQNDDYSPSKARDNIQSFLSQNIDTIVLPVGSPTLSSYLDIIEGKKVLVIFPISGGTAFRSKSLEQVIHFRCSYAKEVKALIDYAYTEWNARKFALFYQDDSYGQGPFNEAQKILSDKKCTIISVPYSRATTNLSQEAKKINETQPDVIAFFSTAQTTIELIRELGIENIVNKKLLGISFFAEESFRNFSERHNIPVLIGAVVPNPFMSDLEIVKEYRTAMDSAGYSYDVFSLEAYIGTSILIEVLKKIDAPYTKEKIYAELIAIKNMNLKGISLSYSPENHTLFNTVYLETGNNKPWIEKTVGDINYDTNTNNNRSEQKTNATKDPSTQSLAS